LPRHVGRANNDGSDVRNKFIPGSGEGSDCGVAVDSSHVYWVNSLTRTGQSVGLANLDGAGVNQNFIANQFLPCQVAVDSTHIYWTPGIMESNFDGTNVQRLVPGVNGCGVAVDSDHIYWGPAGSIWAGRA
jgi:hypothetical protein